MDPMPRTIVTKTTTTATTTTTIPSNLELHRQRVLARRAKRQARKQSIQEKRERQLKVKEILYPSSNSTDANTTAVLSSSPVLYAIKVTMCDELRRDLRLNSREKRGRIFVETDSAACKSLSGLQSELHGFFRSLRKRTYQLQARLPTVSKEGFVVSVMSPGQDDDTWVNIESNEDVVEIFASVNAFFDAQRNNDTAPQLKRPTLLLHVSKDPNAPEVKPPTYLENMADPSQTESMTMLSFYAFPPCPIADPDAFAMMLRSKWKPFGALGRVYVAREGVNAQMSVPTNVLENFMACCHDIEELGQWMENGVNVDPVPLSVEEFATAGVPVHGQPAPPFRNLHIRVRNQIVADGLDAPLDWQSAGYDMPPMEWHRQLQERDGGDDKPILLDCRNSYETDLGRFEGAEPLNTEAFRDSWDVLKQRLEDTPKDAPIMTYCTGGIRCVKVGAYLTQELGFTNVSRLAGGIVAYDRTLQEKKVENSLFRGTNFVFDGRLGRTITEDNLGTCFTCGAETSLVTNCLNHNCHKRIVQCERCNTAYHGTCSESCKQRVLQSKRQPPETATTSVTTTTETSPSTKIDTLEEYSEGHSSPRPSFYHEVDLNTRHYLGWGAHMVSGSSQGRWLTQLASMTREARILELGTFSGYATACFVEGAYNAGSVMGCKKPGSRAGGGPFVLTLERNRRALDLAVAHLNIMTKHGLGEEAAEAACALRGAPEGQEVIPKTQGDLTSLTYKDIVGCEVLRVNDALATLEDMARQGQDQQESSDSVAPFDLVFVDADKTRLLEYVEVIVNNDFILKKGGWIVVDNVLWKGLVMEASTGSFSSTHQDDDDDDDDDLEDGDSAARKNRRARKLAFKMHAFNSQIVKDPRVEVAVLPIRDGLSVIRKR